MKLSFKTDLFAQSSEVRTLADIIGEIKSGMYEDTVCQIRQAEEKETRQNLKKGLPVFFPSVRLNDECSSLSKCVSASATGIVQYDIDDYSKGHSDQLLRKLKRHSHVLYAFRSPSGGVKFGIRTNFKCDDLANIAKKYSFACDVVMEKLGSEFQSLAGVDTSAERISQQCYLSYDSDVYLNENCSELFIEDEIEKLFAAFEKGNLTDKTFVDYSVENDEVLRCLSYLPSYLPYAERLTVNFAVIDHFGPKARSVLLKHWVGVQDKRKLEKQIDSQIANFDGRITVATLFHLSKTYGYELASEEQHVVPTNKNPTYHSVKYYSAAESTARLEHIIKNGFFENKKDTAVIVECGAGKTRTMISAVAEYLSVNRHAKIAVFLKTHEMSQQFVTDLRKQYDNINRAVIAEYGVHRAYGKTMAFNHTPIQIKSMADSCLSYEKAVVEKTGSALCSGCYYASEGGCPYIEQFDAGWPNSNIRVYTHNRLFTKPGKDLFFNPDYIIVDEDIVSLMTSTDETLLRLTETNDPALAGILNLLSDDVHLAEAAEKHVSGLKDSLSATSKKLSVTASEIAELNALVGFQAAKRQQLYDKLKELQMLKKLIVELQHLAIGNKLQSKSVWVQRTKHPTISTSLVYGQMRGLLAEYRDVPLLYLDGSGERKVIEAVIGREFDFEHLRVHQQHNAQVYQFTKKASFSKRSFSAPSGQKKVQQICEWIDTLDTQKLGLIRYNRINADNKVFAAVDQKIVAINGDEKCIGWFGNVRGVNKFEDCDTLLVIGQHRLPDYEIFNLTQLMFRADVFDGEKSLVDIQIAKKGEVEKVYRLKDGNHVGVQQEDYVDEFCALVSGHFDKAETYQALHRLRLVHGEENKTVYVLSDTVLDVSLDGLLDRFKEFNEQSLAVVQYLKEHKFLIDSNDAFEQAFGWSSADAKSFRASRGYGSWLREHRSLKYWVSKTKERKTIKVFSWGNQTGACGGRFLSENGHEVRSMVCV